MKTPRTEFAGNRAAGSPALGPVTPEQREATAGSYSLNVSPAPATDAHDPEHAAAGPEPQVGSSSLQPPGPRRSLLGQVLQPVRQLLRWLLHVSGLLAMGGYYPLDSKGAVLTITGRLGATRRNPSRHPVNIHPGNRRHQA